MTATESPKSPLIAVVQHHNDLYGAGTARNTVAALDQARIPFACIDISEPLADLARFTAVLICTERLDQAPPATAVELEHFVSGGGGLVVLHRGVHSAFCTLFGILAQDLSAATTGNTDAAGLHFPSRVLPAYAGLRLDASVIDGHAAFDVVPAAQARIVATTWTGKPLSWRTQLGAGYVLYWNSTIFGASRTRGLIVAALDCVVPISVTPIANVGVVQIDDFPAPLLPPTDGLGGVGNPAHFYSDIWWPDVHRLASHYKMALTCFAMFDYSDTGADDHKNPFAMIGSANLAAIRRLPPAEIGLHGYNHTPLTRKDWPDQAKMLRSVARAMTEWNDAGLGPPPTSYVPPMNAYDSHGISALVAQVPGLRVISGALTGSMGGTTPRDFGPEPWNDALFDLPRATCGHECSDEMLFDCANVVAGMGVWTHFLHPDDLTDVPGPVKKPDAPRNPFHRPWRSRGRRAGLYDQLARLFSSVNTRFPWLVFRATTQGAEVVRQFLQSDWDIALHADRVVVRGPVGGYFRLRTNGPAPLRIDSCTGGKITHHEQAKDFCAYIIETHAETVEILLTEAAPSRSVLARMAQKLRPVRPVATPVGTES